jgi:hypothetical protein
LLRAVEHGWREERIQKNASEISALGAELYNRVARMTTTSKICGETGWCGPDLQRSDWIVRRPRAGAGSQVQGSWRRIGEEIAIQEQIKTTTRVVQSQSLLELPDERNGRQN